MGEEVRYYGGHKLDRYLVGTLGCFVEWVPVQQADQHRGEIEVVGGARRMSHAVLKRMRATGFCKMVVET